MDGGLSQPGHALGRYLVIEEVGRGGMGMVMRAYDPRLQREVALKLVKSHDLSPESQARVLREAQAMAKLSHPNVVAVHDVDIVESEREPQVVIAMEFVRGETLKTWLEQPRPWAVVVEMFIGAGRGLAAAHAAGLLHRDFKPANVLVGEDHRARVTDFGLARRHDIVTSESAAVAEALQVVDASHSPLQGIGAELTQTGSIVGTPRYMAPEQHDGGALSPASDQYGFCVALWEALTRRRLFDVSGPGALAEAKREGPPPWPRDVPVPRRVVDAIYRGLALRPADRWPSISALLTALDDDPRRRRRGWMLAASSIVTLAASGTSIGLWHRARLVRCSGAHAQIADAWNPTRLAAAKQAVLATGQTYAHEVWADLEPRMEAFAAQWMAVHEEACEATSVRGEQSTAVMDLRMACLHRAKVQLAAVASMFERADAQVVEKAHEIASVLPNLERCSDPSILRAEVPPPEPELEALVESVRVELADVVVLQRAGKTSQALPRAQSLSEHVRSIPYEPIATEVMLELGILQSNSGDYPEAEATLKEVLALGLARRQWETALSAGMCLMNVIGFLQSRPAQAEAYAETVRGLVELTGGSGEGLFRHHLGGLLRSQGRHEEAAVQFRKALELQQDQLGPEHRDVAIVHDGLGLTLLNQGRYEEAIAEFRTALAIQIATLGAEHPFISATRANLAGGLQALGRYDESELELRRVSASLAKAYGPRHPNVAAVRNNLGLVLEAQGRLEEAEAEHRAVLALRLEVLGADNPFVGSSHHSLAMTLNGQGRHVEAESHARSALSIWRSVLGPEHTHVAAGRGTLATALHGQGRLAEAEAEHRAALALQLETLGATHPNTVKSRSGLGVTLRALHRYDEAQRELVAALDGQLGIFPAEHPAVVQAQHDLASLYMDQKAWDQARPLLEQAWKSVEGESSSTPSMQAEIAFALAQVVWRGADDRPRALQLAQDAMELYERGGAGVEAVRSVEAWLRQRRAASATSRHGENQ